MHKVTISPVGRVASTCPHSSPQAVHGWSLIVVLNFGECFFECVDGLAWPVLEAFFAASQVVVGDVHRCDFADRVEEVDAEVYELVDDLLEAIH